MENISSIVEKNLLIPPDYVSNSEIPGLLRCYLNGQWLRNVVRELKFSVPPLHNLLTPEEVKSCLELDQHIGNFWGVHLLQVLEKKNVFAFPLGNTAGKTEVSCAATKLSFSQLMQYISSFNYKSSWKECFARHPDHAISLQWKENTVDLHELHSNIMRDVLTRIYNCPLIQLKSNNAINVLERTRSSEPQPNIHKAICILEGVSHFFLVMTPGNYSVQHCLNFSPCKLSDNEIGFFFILYQLLKSVQYLHDQNSFLGDITLHHLRLSESLYTTIIPQFNDGIVEATDLLGEASSSTKVTPREAKDDSSSKKPGKRMVAYLSLISSSRAREIMIEGNHNSQEKSYDQLKSSLVELTQLWACHELNNLDYLLCLNYYAGHSFESSIYHPTLPWVTDFSTPNGGWRDLSRSKYRLNKGDEQLDLTFNVTEPVPEDHIAHHVPEVFDEITYYIYKARQTPKEVLQRHVRNQFVPSHYSSSIARMYAWTPAECIPEFYLSPQIFKSIHSDLPDLEIPSWCESVEKFLEYHRGALESNFVSRRLHHWIDLNFGYKLSGSASIKSKNVCLPLVDSHQDLSRGGLIQLFTIPHPPKLVPSLYLSKIPPNIPATLEKSQTNAQETRKPEGFEDSSKPRSQPAEKDSIQLPFQFNPLTALNQVEFLFNYILKIKGKTPHPSMENFSAANSVRKLAHLRRVKDMQVIGCLMVEMFLYTKTRTIGPNASLDVRYKHAYRLVKNEITLLPRSLHSVLRTIFQIETQRDELPQDFAFISKDGLPPPTCHQMLQPLLNMAMFPKSFRFLYPFTVQMFQYSELINEASYISNKKDRDIFIKKTVDVQVKTAAHCLSKYLPDLSIEEIKILLPYVIHLYEQPSTSVSAAWYLTETISQALGPSLSKKYLLSHLLRLYESDAVSDKHLKLFHRTFLLQLSIRFGLKTFVKHLIIPLIEGVGGYKEFVDPTMQESDRSPRQLKNLRSVDLSFSADADQLSPYDEESKSISQSFATSSSILERPSDKSTNLENTDVTETDNDLETFFVFDNDDGVEDDDDDTLEDIHDGSGDGFNDRTRSPHGLDTLSFDETSIQDELGQGGYSPCASPASISQSTEEKLESSITSPSAPKSINIEGSRNALIGKSSSPFSTSLPTKPQILSLAAPKTKNTSSPRGRRSMPEKLNLENSIVDVCCESILWLSHRLGPVLTARYLTRNLLRMLTLCYLPESNALELIPPDAKDELSLTRKRVQGDKKSAKIIHCLLEIAGLYGEQMILLQYICHITELINLCEGKLSSSQEASLIGGMVLFQEVILQLSDPVFMDQLQNTLIKSAIYPIIRLLSSSKVCFPSGGSARSIIAWRVVDCIFIMALRVGREMSIKKLTPAFTRFLNAFDKVYVNKASIKNPDVDDPNKFNSSDKAKLEMKEVFTPELAYLSYVPLCRFLGTKFMEDSLPNHDLLHSLCVMHDDNKQSDHAAVLTQDCLNSSKQDGPSSSNTKVAVTGNRIDIKNLNDNANARFGETKSIGFAASFDISKYVSTKMENNLRHLRGNWLAYWEHETGLSDRNTQFNFKQIKLQNFIGHSSVVKSLCVLDNENSFLSCSKDRTVKLWSLRSQGDGSAQCHSQSTYIHHKKPVFDVTFNESERLVGSCDSTVHIWDPFVGKCVKQLDSLKHSPVTALVNLPAPSKCMMAATSDATLKLIDLRTLSYAQELKISASPVGLIRCVTGRADGNLVAVAHSSGVVSTLDLRNGQLLSSLKLHEGEVRSLQWVEKGIFVSSALDQTICTWNSQDSKQRFLMRGPNDQVHFLRVLNSQLISGSGSNRIGVHSEVSPNANFSSTKLRSDAFRGALTAMSVLPLNRQILLGSDNGLIALLC